MNQQDKEHIKELLRQNPGSKIQTIKTVREKFGLGLKEAKEVVDQLFAELSKEDPIFKQASENKGCFSILLGALLLYFMAKTMESSFS